MVSINGLVVKSVYHEKAHDFFLITLTNAKTNPGCFVTTRPNRAHGKKLMVSLLQAIDVAVRLCNDITIVGFITLVKNVSYGDTYLGTT